jgi:hypothetical protein
MQWIGDVQIKIGSSAPTSEQGPAMAFSGARFYLAYAGTNGFIYWAWTDNNSLNFTDWQGNEQLIWIDSTKVESLITPGLVFFDGLLVLISTDTRFQAVRVSYFDGNQWTGYILDGLFQPGLTLFNLSASVVGDQLQLFVFDSNGNSIHLVCTGAITELSSWANVGTTQGEYTASVGPLGVDLCQLGTFTTQSGQPFYALYGAGPTMGTSQPQPYQTGVVEVADGSPNVQYANTFLMDAAVGLIYLAPGDTQLYQAVIKLGYVNGNMLLNPSDPVQIGFGKGDFIKSNALPSPMIYPFISVNRTLHNGFCMAHKGNDNSNLYLSYGWGLL